MASNLSIVVDNAQAGLRSTMPPQLAAPTRANTDPPRPPTARVTTRPKALAEADRSMTDDLRAQIQIASPHNLDGRTRHTLPSPSLPSTLELLAAASSAPSSASWSRSCSNPGPGSPYWPKASGFTPPISLNCRCRCPAAKKPPQTSPRPDPPLASGSPCGVTHPCYCRASSLLELASAGFVTVNKREIRFSIPALHAWHNGAAVRGVVA
jgi:hypothetical protein